MIAGIDHVVLTVSDIEGSVAFYERALRMEPVTFGNGRRALRFGDQKINLQRLGQEPRNHAAVGSGDLCLITEWPLEAVVAHLATVGITPIEGPARKQGALGPITSIYFLDPDRNLIEVSTYAAPQAL
ncbi:MAG TPA: VOC family protein [Holophagaceae bacterium]|nr:VOC family protein [Holophagaceae bacterium]